MNATSIGRTCCLSELDSRILTVFIEEMTRVNFSNVTGTRSSETAVWRKQNKTPKNFKCYLLEISTQMIRKKNRRNEENQEEAERHPVSPIMGGGRPYSDDKKQSYYQMKAVS